MSETATIPNSSEQLERPTTQALLEYRRHRKLLSDFAKSPRYSPISEAALRRREAGTAVIDVFVAAHAKGAPPTSQEAEEAFYAVLAAHGLKTEDALEREAIRWADEASASSAVSSFPCKTPNNQEKIEDAQASGPPRAQVPPSDLLESQLSGLRPVSLEKQRGVKFFRYLKEHSDVAGKSLGEHLKDFGEIEDREDGFAPRGGVGGAAPHSLFIIDGITDQASAGLLVRTGMRLYDSKRGVPSDRVCVSCSGPVWWSGTAQRLECAACGGTDYRLCDPVVVSRVEHRSLEKKPEWERFGFRGKVASLLWDRGLKKKAERFANCNRQARPGKCTRYPLEHKYYVPDGCGVPFCRECAEVERQALFVAYLEVIRRAVLDFAGELQGYNALSAILSNKHTEPKIRAENELALRELWSRVARYIREKDWVLARINFTLWSDGSEITPDRVEKMNTAIRSTMRKSVGKARGYGMLFDDEVGFETRGHIRNRKARGLNLHAHGIYFGPYLDWERTRDLWMRETQKPKDKKNFFLLVSVNGPDPVYMEFDRVALQATGPQAISVLVASRGFWVNKARGFGTNPERAIRHALNHMLKYVSKPPAVTPERLTSLIAAFDTKKRVHSLGLFYGEKPKREKHDCPCPKCRALGLDSSVSFEGSALPDGGYIPRFAFIEDLRKLGYEPLRGDGRTANFGDVPLERVQRAPP